jgi:HNH endonuclease
MIYFLSWDIIAQRHGLAGQWRHFPTIVTKGRQMSDSDSKLTANQLRELVYYDQNTGIFLWRPKHRKMKSGPIGNVTAQGYIQLNINRKSYKIHRLAWLYVTGQWPINGIDHINGIKTDNKFSNLRDATHDINHQNLIGPCLRNKTGLLGVSPHGKKWRAQITVNGKNRIIGLFDSPDAAHTAYLESKRKLHKGCTI